MLNPKVDMLFEVTIAYDFIDDDTDSAFCNIVDDACSTVISHSRIRTVTSSNETLTHPW